MNFSYTATGGLLVSQGCPQVPDQELMPDPLGPSAVCWFTVNPSMGTMTGPPASVRNDLLASATWQNWAGSSYATHVHVVGANSQGALTFPTPFSVVMVTEESFETKIETGNFVRGSLKLWFQDVVPPCVADETSAFNYFCNNVEQVIKDLNYQRFNGGTQLRRKITYAQRPCRNTADDGQQFYTVMFNVMFGVE